MGLAVPIMDTSRIRALGWAARRASLAGAARAARRDVARARVETPPLDPDACGPAALARAATGVGGAIRRARAAFGRDPSRTGEPPMRPIDDSGDGDALQAFLNRIGEYRLLRPEEELELSRRIEQGDLAAKDRMICANLRLVVSVARQYAAHVAGRAVPGPRAGGHAGADPGGREVRLAPRAPLLHLRDLVDPPGGRARPRRQGGHDPPAGQRRAQAAPDRAGRDAARRRAGPDADRRGSRRVARAVGRGRAAPCATSRGPSRRWTAGSATGATTRPSANCWATTRPGRRSSRAVPCARERALSRWPKLPDRERAVVDLRYGLAGAEPAPLREIGRRLGLTPERVRQIESAALHPPRPHRPHRAAHRGLSPAIRWRRRCRRRTARPRRRAPTGRSGPGRP